MDFVFEHESVFTEPQLEKLQQWKKKDFTYIIETRKVCKGDKSIGNIKGSIMCTQWIRLGCDRIHLDKTRRIEHI